MTDFLRLIFLFLVCFNGFSQVKDDNFSDGEIYIKVKPQFSKKINSTSKDLNVASEVPFVSNTIAVDNISKVEKPFSSPKNKDLNNIIRLKLKDSEKIDDIISQLKESGYYEYVERVRIRKVISDPNDPSFGSQWHLSKIKAPEAWDINPGGLPVVVAVVDNAIQTNHVDLSLNMIAGKDMSSAGDTDPNPPNASFSHGTHVAGIVGAVNNNGIGIASAANNKVKIMPIKTTPDLANPNDIYFGFEGVDWAVENGAKIVSLSWGEPGFSQLEQDVINKAYALGVLVVAAAGNGNNNEPSYPAAYQHVISVASLDDTDKKSSFSSYGNTVDISAPGKGILSTIPFDSYASYNGTSMATPLVSSCLAYIWSCFPSLSIDQIEQVLKSTSDDISGVNPNYIQKLGAGRVNLLNAVSCLSENIANLELEISPSRYFCLGDTVNVSVPIISGAMYEWKRNGSVLIDTAPIISTTQDGTYTLTITKGSCKKSLQSKPLIYNLTKTESPVVKNLTDYYCSSKMDTLMAQSSSCVFPEFYQKNYIGPTVGFDGFEQSGSDITVEMTNVVGLIDSVEITIVWQKKDGDGPNTCSTADGGGRPYNEEVGFNLLAPNGQIFTLIAEGTYGMGITTSGIVTMIFKNNASVVGNTPTSGSFRPQTSFSGLMGELPNGQWRLLPVDNSYIDPLCVSGFGVKVYTDAHLAVQNTTWWDASIGGNKLSDTHSLVLSNLPIGANYYFAQTQCTGLCPSPRQKAEVLVKNIPEILGFPFSNISITRTQAEEIAMSTNIQFSKNASNIYSVSGLNQINQPFNYQISSSPPHISPISICSTVDYVLIAVGCSGTVSWSNGQTNAGIIIQNLTQNLNVSAICNQTWNCPIPPPPSFTFFKASEDKQLSGIVDANSNQSIFSKVLISTQKIQPTSNLLYRATESVLLNPGFSVDKGNVLKVEIGNCF